LTNGKVGNYDGSAALAKKENCRRVASYGEGKNHIKATEKQICFLEREE